MKLLDDDGVGGSTRGSARGQDNVEKVDIADKFRNMKVNNGRTGISASAAADLLYTGGSIKPPADWDGSRTLRKRLRAGLSFTLRVDDESVAGEMCGLFNYMADGEEVQPRQLGVSRVHEIRTKSAKGRPLGSSWFTDENMEELQSYLYSRNVGTSRRRWVHIDESCEITSLGYYDSEDDGEYDSEDDDGEYDSEDDDGEYYDSEERWCA